MAEPNAEISSRSKTFTDTASEVMAVSTRSATTTVYSIESATAKCEETVIDTARVSDLVSFAMLAPYLKEQ